MAERQLEFIINANYDFEIRDSEWGLPPEGVWSNVPSNSLSEYLKHRSRKGEILPQSVTWWWRKVPLVSTLVP